jgi:pyruvate/2-oxoglutarate dehydrogenase complex dihydrolipoamide acyltransferase (E2) component
VSVVELGLPRLGDTVVDGTIGRWLVAPGDTVTVDQPLVEVETDKVTTEYPSEVAGTVVDLLVEEGARVAVGTPILRIALGPDATARTSEPVAEPPPPSAPSPPRPAAAVAEPTPAPVASDRLVPLTPLRAAIAAHVSRSFATTPHALAAADVAVDGLQALRARERDRFRARHGADLSPFALLAAAVGAAFSRAAGRSVDLGLAVAVDGGVIVPVLRDAGRPWQETAPELVELVDRARSGRLTPDEVVGGDTTVTNIGTFGARWAQPVLNRGQATIVALGAIERRPAPRPAGIGWSTVVPVSLVYDAHRLDPIEASALLARIAASVDALAAS